MNVQDFNDIIVINKVPKPNDDTKQFEWGSLHAYKESVSLYGSRRKTRIKTNGKEYIPSPKDKIYFYPGCDVPRYKVRDWAAKNDASVTIKPEKATIKIASEKSKTECYSYDTLVRANKNQFLNWIRHNYNVTDGNITELCTFLEQSQEKDVYLCNDYSRGMGYQQIHGENYNGSQTEHNKKMGYKKGLASFDKGLDMWNTTCYLTDSNKHILESLENDPDVYPQESIIKVINEDATIIDQDMYKSLEYMLGSANKADHIIAIEVMSNCNMAPSLHHVLLLIQQYHQTIFNLKESKHVNFKSLLKYIKVDRNSMHHITEDKMIECLMDKDQLTMQTVKELAEGVKDVWKKTHDSEYFKISKITMSDEVKKYFKEKEQEKAQQEAELV